jgi:hypothetical protein
VHQPGGDGEAGAERHDEQGEQDRDGSIGRGRDRSRRRGDCAVREVLRLGERRLVLLAQVAAAAERLFCCRLLVAGVVERDLAAEPRVPALEPGGGFLERLDLRLAVGRPLRVDERPPSISDAPVYLLDEGAVTGEEEAALVVRDRLRPEPCLGDRARVREFWLCSCVWSCRSATTRNIARRIDAPRTTTRAVTPASTRPLGGSPCSSSNGIRSPCSAFEVSRSVSMVSWSLPPILAPVRSVPIIT